MNSDILTIDRKYP